MFGQSAIKTGHVIITGTGRAGTTFLVQLFSALKLDTGFSFEQAMSRVDDISKAGLEFSLFDKKAPYILKSPWFCEQLDEVLERKIKNVKLAIVPMREIEDAAESRRRVFREAEAAGLDPLANAGTIWGTDGFAGQETALMHQFYQGLLALATYQIPIKLLKFPRLVSDPEYLFAELEDFLLEHDISETEFADAFRRTSQPELVHDFATPSKSLVTTN